MNNNKILNPRTGRMVEKSGKIGKQLLGTPSKKTVKSGGKPPVTINSLKKRPPIPVKQLKKGDLVTVRALTKDLYQKGKRDNLKLFDGIILDKIKVDFTTFPKGTYEQHRVYTYDYKIQMLSPDLTSVHNKIPFTPQVLQRINQITNLPENVKRLIFKQELKKGAWHKSIDELVMNIQSRLPTLHEFIDLDANALYNIDNMLKNRIYLVRDIRIFDSRSTRITGRGIDWSRGISIGHWQY